MSRLPIRWRVTLAFSVALLVVLGAVGAFVYLRFEADLQRTLDAGLRARADEIRARVQRADDVLGAPRPRSLEADESVSQILREDGTVAAASGFGSVPLLTPEQVRRARAGALLVDRPGDARIDESLRLLAVPVDAAGARYLVVVGASRDEKDESLSSLLLIELAGLGLAVVLAGGAGWWVAGVGLRPVEAMRRRAEEITDEPDRRLPAPAVDDELGRLARTLNAMLDRLGRARTVEREAVAAQRRFVADASHELRTPLTILKGEIEVALLEPRSAAELEAALASAGEETARLCRLAEELLLLAEAGEGGLPVLPGAIDLEEMLGAVAGREGRAAASAGRSVEVDVPPGLTVVADRLHLERAVGNLVDNAIRHGAGEIRLSAARDAEDLVIAVRDHGPGFPPGFLAHAFEPFRRAAAGRPGAGSGLGLAIVDVVARAHGGTAGAEDAGPGARVWIRLPARALSPSPHHPAGRLAPTAPAA